MGRRRSISDVGNVQLPVPYHEAVAELALRHAVDARKQAALGLGDVELILRLLVAGKGVVLAGKMGAYFGQPVGEDALIHPG